MSFKNFNHWYTYKHFRQLSAVENKRVREEKSACIDNMINNFSVHDCTNKREERASSIRRKKKLQIISVCIFSHVHTHTSSECTYNPNDAIKTDNTQFIHYICVRHRIFAPKTLKQRRKSPKEMKRKRFAGESEIARLTAKKNYEFYNINYIDYFYDCKNGNGHFSHIVFDACENNEKIKCNRMGWKLSMAIVDRINFMLFISRKLPRHEIYAFFKPMENPCITHKYRDLIDERKRFKLEILLFAIAFCLKSN